MSMEQRWVGIDAAPIDNPTPEFVEKWTILYKKHKSADKFDKQGYLKESYNVALNHQEQQMLLWVARKMETEWSNKEQE